MSADVSVGDTLRPGEIILEGDPIICEEGELRRVLDVHTGVSARITFMAIASFVERPEDKRKLLHLRQWHSARGTSFKAAYDTLQRIVAQKHALPSITRTTSSWLAQETKVQPEYIFGFTNDYTVVQFFEFDGGEDLPVLRKDAGLEFIHNGDLVRCSGTLQREEQRGHFQGHRTMSTTAAWTLQLYDITRCSRDIGIAELHQSKAITVKTDAPKEITFIRLTPEHYRSAAAGG